MPFITEELFQRLPKRSSDKAESITVARYPNGLGAWSQPDLEAKVSGMMDVVRTIRSMKEEYVNTKAKPPIFLRASDPEMRSIIEEFTSDIMTLSTTTELRLLNDGEASPLGCAVELVGSRAEVMLMLKGIVDLSKEVEKLRQKQTSAKQQEAKLTEAISKPDYATKVP